MEMLRMPKVVEIKMSDLIDVAVCAIIHENGDLLDYITDIFPNTAEEDIQNYFIEYSLILEEQREAIEDQVQVLIDILKEKNKWVS